MAKIFISYRRQDTEQIIASIYNFVALAFGPDALFIDTKSIPAGANFMQTIEQNLIDAKVMLVFIGKDWLGDESNGRMRINQIEDPVHMEVKLGLEYARQGRLAIIPVLIDNAPMPSFLQLPTDLTDLHRYNAEQIHSSLTYFNDDVNRLLAAINQKGLSRLVEGRIEAVPERLRYTPTGFILVAANQSLSPPAAPLIRNAPSVMLPAPKPQLPAIKPPILQSNTIKSTDIFAVIAAVVGGVGGFIIRAGIAILVVVGGVIVIHNVFFNPLTEHSSCQDYQQATADAQTKVLQDMMTAHKDHEYIQTVRFSVNLYCNLYGSSAPIDGIYSNGSY